MCLVVSNIRKEFTMATKLKNLHMTSVDLVRNGANQKADICLFKSADPTETTTEPTTEEKNIFKRFLNWLRENPTEEQEEPTAPIEKADEEPYLVEIYKSAITESLQSIAADETLSETEKNDLIAKSLDEYHEAMLGLFGFEPEEEPLQKADDEEDDLDDWEWDEDPEDEAEEVEKFNPYHGADGRFTSASGGGGGGASPKHQTFSAATNSRGAKRKEENDKKISEAKEGLKRVNQELKTAKDPKRRSFLEATRSRYEKIINDTGKFEPDFDNFDEIDKVGKSADIDEIEEV